MSPREIRLPAGWSRTETPLIAVTVTRFDLEGINAVPGWITNERNPLRIRVTLEQTGGGRCVNVSPDWVNFFIVVPE